MVAIDGVRERGETPGRWRMKLDSLEKSEREREIRCGKSGKTRRGRF